LGGDTVATGASRPTGSPSSGSSFCITHHFITMLKTRAFLPDRNTEHRVIPPRDLLLPGSHKLIPHVQFAELLTACWSHLQ
jgi:hypothetical protein